jgi:hypothetical protein
VTPSGGIDVADLRFGYAPIPESIAGYDPQGDAQALTAPGLVSPARRAIPGRQYTGSYAPNERYVARIPAEWNGKLAVAGTAGWRCEFSNDAIWSDYLLARGYAFASSNKALAVNVIGEPLAESPAPQLAYRFPFPVPGVPDDFTVRCGMLSPRTVGVGEWNEDYVALVRFARELVRAEAGRAPFRTLAVGLSNGGAQVRTLLERHGELADGGLEWSGVYWSGECNFLHTLPTFLTEMRAYVESGYTDRASAERIEQAGFPPDRLQNDDRNSSLWDHYYRRPPFYPDLTTFAYALALDPGADPEALAQPAGRARYVPSAQAAAAIAPFAHSGALERPLVSIAGTADMFITPAQHAVRYAAAIAAAGRADRHRLVLVEGGTHVDSLVPNGYGLVPMAPFAWAAFELLERTVEAGANLGGTLAVARPEEIR